jgi:hypothetical protein
MHFQLSMHAFYFLDIPRQDNKVSRKSSSHSMISHLINSSTESL